MEPSYSSHSSTTRPQWEAKKVKGFDAEYLHRATLYKDYMIVYGFCADFGHRGGPFHTYHIPTNNWLPMDLDESEQDHRFQVYPAYSVFDSDKILIYGGVQEMCPINTVSVMQITEEGENLKIKAKKVDIQEGPIRSNHSGDIYENRMLVFGGMVERTNYSKNSVSNELWSMNLESFKWAKCETTGTQPISRYDHSSLVHEKKLYIYGGLSPKGDNFKTNSISILDLESMKWERIIPKGIICPPRAQAILAIFNNTLCIFGGRVKEYSSMFAAPMFLYNKETNVLETVFQRENREIERMDNPHGVIYKNSLIVAQGRRNPRGDSPPIFHISFDNSPQEKSQDTEKFGELLFSDKDSDISFLIEDTKIPAHKNILKARCPYFDKMFASGMEESRSSCIKIDDIKLDTFKNFLTFLYTGQIQLNHPIALELYRLADKYQQKELFSQCEEYLLDNLWLSTFHETATLAGECGSDQLRADITRYIKIHRLEIKANPGLLCIPEAYKNVLED